MSYIALFFQFVISIPKIIDFIKSISKSIDDHNERNRQERHDNALDEARNNLNDDKVDKAKKEKVADDLLDSV